MSVVQADADKIRDWRSEFSKILSEHASKHYVTCHAINNAVRFIDARFCECNAALMQKYIGLYLLTAARSHALIVVV